MNDDMINEVARQVLDQIRDSATRDETVAAKLHDEAKGYRQQAEAYEARAASAEANALIHETSAQIKRQFTALLAGQPGLPTPGAVVPIGELGMGIGVHRLAPPAGVPLEEMTAEQVTSVRDLMEAVYGLAFDRVAKANEWLRQHRSTLDTATLAPEDVPVPDPLTAAPAEDSGGHTIPPYAEHVGHRVEITTRADERITAKVVDVNAKHLFYDVGPGHDDPVRFLPLEHVTAVRPAGVSLAGRPLTPDRKEIGEDGREHTVITGKRCCNGCGLVLGDVTEAEVLAVIESGGLPDVRGECPSCSAPGAGEADAAEPDEPEPGQGEEPPAGPKKTTALQGIARVAGGFPLPRRHKAPGKDSRPAPYAEHVGRDVIVTTSTLRMGGRLDDVTATALLFRVRVGGSYADPEEIPLEQVERVEVAPDRAAPAPGGAAPRETVPDGAVSTAAVEEPRAYPEEPSVPAVPVDPAQARLDDLALQMREDAPTEAFARVPGDGDAR